MSGKGLSNKGIILIDKPKGITSFDVIRVLRRKLGIKKMGHSGTLDPMATGLMLVGVSEGTKTLKELIKLPKTYEASVLLGVRTATGDLEGDVLERKAVKEIDTDKVKDVVNGLKGKLFLQVPVYSAVKVKGQRLYKLARKGKKVEPPVKKMEVTKAHFVNLERGNDFYVLNIVLDVKSGTYVRSIAEEIGRRLGLPATLGDLRRTKIGRYKIEDAAKLH